jgi:hypothetical protein
MPFNEIFVDISNHKVPKREKAKSIKDHDTIFSHPNAKADSKDSNKASMNSSKAVKSHAKSLKATKSLVKSVGNSNSMESNMSLTVKNDVVVKNLQKRFTFVKDENGGVYSGPLNINGIREGKGIYTYPRGDGEVRSQWQGNFRNGKVCGTGEMSFIDGKIFKGVWQKGKMHQGIQIISIKLFLLTIHHR